ncbi:MULTISPECIES: LuxR family transcriptional regulator [unclassified Mesorhizobium]|uniref:helix-turn-helix transcriptional regulator n=1 Tax=unclassified Mesorhizobium TaxID=325217 RepID=UPI000FCB2BDC|nr:MULTISPECIES: LuxR family transcriptional regulator [unclassified Mesorhizobium]RVC47288.1 LuxR family transcriptional regulator [Mesorhizobium sp. M4A.F.Ca.ET.090.04.2.1]RWJ20896.1 MAG: LuxR family transcriptional regulator [Mesorhizobium sp.]RWN06291.1 MAG: LuxR family transcriptional regulator [Mesorhizobium sp.]RWN09085.1 MAG: LuxR family transcriptional regulator [Mesorhizobium sp.]RWQ55972.1 MAG: LuxR family transcriptional regulator [Mesorhizobium sp.]
MELPRIAVELGLFLEMTDDIAQPEQLFEQMSAFALKFDCPWIAYGPLASKQRVFKRVRRDSAVMWNYPDEWQEHYSKMGYAKIDPLIKKSRRGVGAFRWSEVYTDKSTTEDERRVLDEAATFGLRSGVTIPLHGPADSFRFMSFAQSSDCELLNRTITYLQMAALQFHLRVAKLGTPTEPEQIHNLSPREIECIYWVSKGKSSWEIGTILGRSRNTIDFHLKNVMRKLDATSRTVAVVKALKLGIIEPP